MTQVGDKIEQNQDRSWRIEEELYKKIEIFYFIV